MKKKLLIIVSLLAAALVFILPACKKEEPKPSNNGEYTITLSDPTLQLDVLDRVDIAATVKNPAGNVADSQVSWVSSDPSVVTVSNGTVDALKAGTATITATAEGKSAECEVTVSAMVRPQIIVTPTDLALKVNGTATVSPSVKFKSRTLDNTEYNITYSFESSDTDIVSVSNGGAVSAKEVGDAEITVTANVPLATSAAIDGNLTQKINVSVEPDYKLVLSVEEGFGTEIYLKEFTDGSVTYKETSQVVVSEASLNGENILSGWIFKSSDETVATVSENGEITLASTAGENDTVIIHAEYEKDGYLFKSNEIEFTVRKATLDLTLSDELMLDLSVEGLIVDSKLFGNDFVITDVKDSEKPAVSLWNNGSVNKDAVTGLGERKLIIESQTINYRVDAWVVSKVIKTASEITALFGPQNGNVPVVNGYYVLGQDIEAGNASFGYRAYSSSDGQGLVGTFDGRGHTVNGFKINTAGGIFGVVSTTGIVKNVAFTNVEVNSTGHAVVLAYFVHGTIENVFVGINKLSSTSEATTNTTGLVSQTAGAATLKNIVVINNSDIGVKAGDYGVLEAKSNVGAWENVFVVSGDDKLFGGATTSGDTMSQYGKSIEKFATVTELLASNYYNEKKAEYPEDIWDKASMTFTSSADFIKAELTTLKTSAELKTGEATALVQNSRIYALSSQSDKLSIADGKVTALEKIAAADNVTVTVSWGGFEKVIAITTAFENAEVEHGYYSFNKGDLTVTSEEFTGIGAVVSVMLGTNNLTSQATLSSGALTITQGAIGDTMFGPQDLIITGENKAVTVKITVAYELNTKTDVTNLYDYLVLENGLYTGYLILGNDIDLEKAIVRNNTAGGIAKSGLKFAGVFDGCGHKIYNYEVPNAGTAGISIFSTVTGTIKNLRIEDVTVSGKSGALVGNELRDGGQLENIYVSGIIAGDGVATGNALRNFGSSLLVGRITTNNTKITNVIVNVQFSDPEPTLYLGSAFGVMNTGYENVTFENCFVICEKEAFAYRKQGTAYTMEATPNVPEDWTLQAFNTTNNKGNGNFTDMAQAWNNTTAAAILEGLGVANPTA